MMGEPSADPYKELDKAATAKGDEDALEAAVLALKPFAFRTEREAINAQDRRHDQRRHVGPVTYLTRKGAKKAIIEIAKFFNVQVHEAGGAPRLADVQVQLASIADAAKILSRRLSYMSEYAERALQASGLRDQGMSNEEYGHRRERFRTAAADYLRSLSPHINEILGENRPPAWTERLDALSQICVVASQSYARFYLADASGKKDRGGHTTAFTKEQGNPLWTMIAQSAEVFEAVNPRRISGKKDGPFFDFVCRVFDYATGGNSTEELEQIGWRVKKVAALFRKAARLHEEMSVLEVELGRLRKRETGKRNLALRRRARRRLNELRREELHIAAWLSLGASARKIPGSQISR